MSIDSTNGNFTWWNTAATTTGSTFNNLTFTVNGTSSWHPVIPDKNWMPYSYVEYEPKWHKNFASYKNQMQKMWD